MANKILGVAAIAAGTAVSRFWALACPSCVCVCDSQAQQRPARVCAIRSDCDRCEIVACVIGTIQALRLESERLTACMYGARAQGTLASVYLGQNSGTVKDLRKWGVLG